MLEVSEPFKLLISFAIGAVIGLEREGHDGKLIDSGKVRYAPLGLRTFSLVAALGAVTGFLTSSYLLFSLFLSLLVGIVIVVYYIFHSHQTKDIGITTEISLIYSYVLGFLIAVEALPIQLTLAISIVLLLLLSRKEQIKSAISDIKKNELNAFISFLLIALVILPFLPNQDYTLSSIPNLQNILSNFSINIDRLSSIELVNPFTLWTIVALITGVDLFGYMLEKFFGKKKGWLVASFAGGFISSTATTLSLAQESKGKKSVDHLVSAAIFANMASFFQIALLIAVLNAIFFIKSLPVLILLIIASLFTAFYFYKMVKKNENASSEYQKGEKEIINLSPALKFAFLFIIIQFISKIALEFFGQTGFLAATGIGALSGLDAVIINASKLAGDRIDFSLAVTALVLANAVNLTLKTIYSFTSGSREFATKFGISVAIMLLASIVGLLFV